MLYAAELAPQDQSITMTAARLLLALNRLSDARAMLAPVAYNPHADRETREKSVKVIAAIAQGDAKDAMSLMDNWNAKSAGSGK
jgi:Flp pilus assembly protein TadD